MITAIRSGTRYNDQAFIELYLDGIQFDACEFIDSTFTACSFVETIFNKCRFVNCEFKGCDFSLSRVPRCSFINSSFGETKLIGINWAQADWSMIDLGKPVQFNNCALNHSTFIGLDLNGLQVLDCNAVNVDFREADLSHANFSGSDLSESLFIHTNLSEADFSHARNYVIDPGHNNLKNAKFSLPEAMSLLYNMDIILSNGENGS